MKNSIIILAIFAILFTPLNAQAVSSMTRINNQVSVQEQEEAQQPWERIAITILKALGHFEQSEPSKGAVLLIDAVLFYKPEVGFEGIEEKLLSAKKHFLKDEYSKGSKYVVEVIETIKQASGIDSVKSSEQSVSKADAVKDLFWNSMNYFRHGYPAQGMIGILEALVLLTGPKG
ncbi:MAG: hypothetical protein KKF46_00435 [Nanoarchaeota archaeon]|nr:hypothetical protein [Nanoarchaeota archaeon]MBU1320801.1 hypothetical protein [Nanoarchaeota archaeon]MBU1596810.1 hypothetical protein [Nanoarchaeota archaeon]MBU2440880.1 hypothetical protein [Nanoarchaeota archaeon]